MTKSQWLLTGGIFGASFALIAMIVVCSVLLYSGYLHWEFDHKNHHAAIEILEYNLRQGKLLPLPPSQIQGPMPMPAAPPAGKP